MRKCSLPRHAACAAALLAGLAAVTGCAPGAPAYGSGYGPYGYDSYYGSPYVNYGGYYDPHRSQDTVFVPDPGIKCDRSVRICYDRNGANLALTDRYFGSKAEDRLATKLPPDEPDNVFVPKKTVRCDSNLQVCTDDSQPSAKQTRIYFGKKAAKQVQDDP